VKRYIDLSNRSELKGRKKKNKEYLKERMKRIEQRKVSTKRRSVLFRNLLIFSGISLTSVKE
jgi:hypothetical protein